MPTFIVTGNYTASAVKGMVAKPSDREAAARAIVEAAGGKLETSVIGLKSADEIIFSSSTIRAFTAAEFTEMQKKAGKIAKAYQAPGG